MNGYEQMREALTIAKKAICHHARANHTCDSLAWESSTINANCGDILCGYRDLCEAKTEIQKALSEPPRVCDVNTLESLSDFVEKTILTSDLLKDTREIVKSIVVASVRTALTIAYEPTKSK